MRVHSQGVRLAVLAVLLVVGAAACDSGGLVGAATSTTVASDAPGTAKIGAFAVPRTVTCGDQPSTTATVSYSTTGATRREVIVDGRPVPGTDEASGTVEAPVHCDPLEHTVVLVAYDDQGRRTTEKRFLHTDMPAGS